MANKKKETKSEEQNLAILQSLQQSGQLNIRLKNKNETLFFPFTITSYDKENIIFDIYLDDEEQMENLIDIAKNYFAE